MSNKTVEQQVAELTQEQKNNMGKIYKNYVFSLISVVLVGVILIIGIFAYASIEGEKAKDKYDAYQTSQEIREQTDKLQGKITVYGIGEGMELLDEYHKMKLLKPLSLVIGGVVCMIGVIAVYLIFKKKYPYFSEKKYTYLKKMNTKMK